MVALIAVPKAIAFLTTSLFKTGSAPGKPKQTSQTLVLGSSPKLVGQLQKIFVFVFNCACTSSPITTSNSI